MNMLQNSSASLWEAVSTNLDACDPFLSSAEMSLPLRDLFSGSVLGGRCQELSGSSVVIATTDQLSAAAALIELDGVARRITATLDIAVTMQAFLGGHNSAPIFRRAQAREGCEAAASARPAARSARCASTSGISASRLAGRTAMAAKAAPST